MLARILPAVFFFGQILYHLSVPCHLVALTGLVVLLAHMRQVIIHWVINIANKTELPFSFQVQLIQEVKCSVPIHKHSSNYSVAQISPHFFEGAKPCRFKYSTTEEFS